MKRKQFLPKTPSTSMESTTMTHRDQVMIRPPDQPDCVKPRRITSIQELELVQNQRCPPSMLVEYECPSTPTSSKHTKTLSTTSISSESSTTDTDTSAHGHGRCDKTTAKHSSSLSISDTLVSTSVHDNGEENDELEMLILNQTHEHLEHELAKRAEARQMSSRQEIYNAVTMLPTPLLGMYFILMGKWLTESDVLLAREDISNFNFAHMSSIHDGTDVLGSPYSYSFSDDQCITSSLFPNLHSLPPLPTLSIVIGFVLHAPCSIYYHLMCAFRLPPGPKRMDHWSRRLDQAMIHCMSLMTCYGNSGSIDYALIALAFTLDSMYRLFQSGHRPKRILIRMVGAFTMPILPLIANGHFFEVMQLLAIYGVSGWLFSAYPLGGWSHGTFHLVIVLSNPILLVASTKLMASQEAVQTAARCAVLSQAAGFD